MQNYSAPVGLAKKDQTRTKTITLMGTIKGEEAEEQEVDGASGSRGRQDNDTRMNTNDDTKLLCQANSDT